MSKRILFITDPVETLSVKKDTSLFMIEHAQSIGIRSYQCEMLDILFNNNSVNADAREITFFEQKIVLADSSLNIKLQDFDYVFMRKDPPVDQDYMNTLHLLDLAKADGAKVINDPLAIKKFNEKVFALYFKEHIPNTLVSAKISEIQNFLAAFKEIVIKPLDGMGGESIYKINKINKAEKSIIEQLTKQGTTAIVAQEFIPEIYEGDFRILIINGTPFHKTLARIPQGKSFKGNLAAGGKGVAADLTQHQKVVANEIGKVLVANGIIFAGLDMIGQKVTEINITSPTCARQIFEQTGEDPIKTLFSSL
ncbi:MAG: glutathione synthase [Gammaproteobacteria bacterium]